MVWNRNTAVLYCINGTQPKRGKEIPYQLHKNIKLRPYDPFVKII